MESYEIKFTRQAKNHLLEIKRYIKVSKMLSAGIMSDAADRYPHPYALNNRS